MRAWVYSMQILIMLIWALPAFAQTPAPRIQILSAIWSGADVTSVASKYCDGRPTCSYKVAPRFIGEAQNPNDKSFSIQWHCADWLPRRLALGHDATGKTLELNCETPTLPFEPSVWEPVGRAGVAEVPNGGWTPRSPLKFKSSFHSLASANEVNTIQRYLSGTCVSAIKSFLQRGGDFSSTMMRTRFIGRLKDFPVAEAQDLEFFHYSKSTTVMDLLKNRDYEPLFSFPRNRYQTSYNGYEEQDWFFYVAADSASSSSYGPMQLKVYFHPDTLVFYQQGDAAGQSPRYQETATSIQDELIRKDPQLEYCRTSSRSAWAKGILVLLAAEAEHVGLIAYYGVKNQAAFGSKAPGNQWMEVVGPWAIKDIVPGN